jgi:putative transposase
MGLFKNEAIVENSPFRSGPLKGLPEVEEIAFAWVSWYHNERLHSFPSNVPPEECDANCCADKTGPSAKDDANKTAAGKPGILQLWHCHAAGHPSPWIRRAQ